MSLRVFAHGGGVQSTAALVLSAQGRIDFPVHLFANVGDDSENPATLEYVRIVSVPYAEAHGVELVEIRKLRYGHPETLVEKMTRNGSRSIGIPVRASNGAPSRRQCTYNFKLEVIWKWEREHGATASAPAVCGIGFSTDEIERADNKQTVPYQVKVFPLLDLGLRRSDCYRVIADAGLPPPPKSACWFCPFHRPQVWAEMRRDDPELFEKSADLEDLLNERRDTLGKDRVYLTRFGRPLREAIGAAQDTLPIFDTGYDGESCDEGVCFV